MTVDRVQRDDHTQEETSAEGRADRAGHSQIRRARARRRMTGLLASIRVLFAKNWRIKQRESRLNKNRPTTPNAWLFPPMLTDIVLPLVFILYLIQWFCRINQAIVETMPGGDGTRQLSLGNPPHKLQIFTASAVSMLTALPLVLSKANMTLLTLDRPENHAFLAYMDRVYPGDAALGLQAFSKLTTVLPVPSENQADAVLRDYPLEHGVRVYMGFDLRRATPLAPFESRVFLYEQDDQVARLLTNQVAKYYTVSVHETVGDSDSRSLEAPGILPLEMALSLHLREQQGDSTPVTQASSSVSPADACDTVDEMLAAAELTWRDLPDNSPLRGSVSNCRKAIQHGRVSQKSLAFLAYLTTLLSSTNTLEKLDVDALPKRPQNTVAGQLDTSIILYLSYLFLWPYSRLIRDVVVEKEKQLKEYLLIMGLSPMALLVSWFLVYAVASLVVVAVAVAMLSGYMFTATLASELHFALLLLVFATSMLLFAVAVTPIFNQSKTAAGVAPLLYFILGVSKFLRSWLGDDIVDDSLLKYVVWAMAHVSSPVVFMETVQQIVARDAITGLARPIAWATVAGPSLQIAVQCVGYLILGWYLESVFPRTFGVQRPWYFVLQPSYWLPGRFSSQKPDEEDEELKHLTDIEGHSDFPIDDTIREQSMADYLHHFRPMLLVKSLSKRYPNGKLAVRSVSFGVKKGEIFGLLGPNGAGKSTTMAMLCGMLSPTAGDAFVGSTSVVADPQAIRKSISVCFQQNILFDDLTVWEHLELVYSLKTSLGIKAVDQELWPHKLSQFGLDEKQHALAQTLSGGQKRKLSLVLALLDTSRVVLLDEPTAGMDLKARVDTWDALKKAVSHRAVILTTHSMQEAQALCENIGIVADGKLQCCGSSLFLRERFGVGYKLTVVHDHTNSQSNGASTSRDVMAIVTKHVPTAVLVSSNKWETRVQLHSDEPAQLLPIFQALERLKQTRTVQRYAVAATDLEDVFVQVTDGGDVYCHQDEQASKKTKPMDGPQSAISREATATPALTQLRTLVHKRWRLMVRDKRNLWSQYIWPLVFFALLLALSTRSSSGGEDLEIMTQLPSSASKSRLLLGALPSASTAAQRLVDALDPSIQHRVDVRAVASADEMVAFLLHDKTNVSFFGAALLANATQFTAFYNESIARSLPVTLSWLSSAYCRSLHPSTASSCELSITKSAFPRPSIFTVGGETHTVTMKPSQDASTRFVVAGVWMLTVSSIAANFITPIVKEREVGVQRLQFLHLASGHASLLYWGAHLVFDLLFSVTAFAVMLAIVYAFDVAWPASSMAVVVVLSLVYSLASLAFVYLVSLVFRSHSSAQSAMSFAMSLQVLGSWVAFGLSMVTTVCGKMRTISSVLRLLPLYAYGEALLYVATPELSPMRDSCDRKTSDFSGELGLLLAGEASPWGWTTSGQAIVYLAGTFVVYMALVLWVDAMLVYPTLWQRRLDWLLRRRSDSRSRPPLATRDKEIIHVANLTKVYNAKQKTQEPANEQQADRQDEPAPAVVRADGQVVAVDKISFAVERNDCVALLGVNGSGKSTTFEILTSGVAPTDGSAFIDGVDVTQQPQAASHSYGYCPQTNIQFAELSVREHLSFFYRLGSQNASPHHEARAIDTLMTRLDLHQVAATHAGHLSGGNKRRLMLALSLLRDDVPLLLMDEPSAGVDVVARRLMWRVLADKQQQTGSLSCLFTTHSMEEAEAVCANAVVLNKGHVVWNGSIPALKHHASRGISITLRLDTARVWEPERTRYFTEKIKTTLKLLEPDIPADRLSEAWRVCRDSHARTKNKVPTNSEQQWLTALVARVQQDPTAASMEAAAFVKEWLLKEAFATIEAQLFQAVVSDRSGEQVKPVELHNALGSGTSATGVYETNCTDSFSLLDAFATMEEHKEPFAIARYSISELSLERVFEQFT